MEKELKKVFQKAKYEESSGLASGIWQNIAIRSKRKARFELWAFSFIGIISLTGLVPALKALSNNLVQSGFYEYFSLIFSNSSSLLSYWKELAFSIAESLPVMSIVLSLSLVFIFFLSIKYATRQVIRGQLSLSF